MVNALLLHAKLSFNLWSETLHVTYHMLNSRTELLSICNLMHNKPSIEKQNKNDLILTSFESHLARLVESLLQFGGWVMMGWCR